MMWSNIKGVFKGRNMINGTLEFECQILLNIYFWLHEWDKKVSTRFQISSHVLKMQYRASHRRRRGSSIRPSIVRPSVRILLGFSRSINSLSDGTSLLPKLQYHILAVPTPFLRIWMSKVSMLLCNWQLWTFEWCFSNLGIQSSYLFSFNFDVKSFNTLQFTTLEVRVNCCGSVKKAKKWTIFTPK